MRDGPSPARTLLSMQCTTGQRSTAALSERFRRPSVAHAAAAERRLAPLHGRAASSSHHGRPLQAEACFFLVRLTLSRFST